MRQLIDSMGGRKFVLALVIFVTGTVLQVLGRLTYEWVALASLVHAIFAGFNASVHKSYAGSGRSLREDSGAGEGFGEGVA